MTATGAIAADARLASVAPVDLLVTVRVVADGERPALAQRHPGGSFREFVSRVPARDRAQLVVHAHQSGLVKPSGGPFRSTFLLRRG